MRSTLRTLACTVALGSLAGSAWADLSAVPSGSYEVDPTHAFINFSYNHLGLSSPKLAFDDFTINLDLDNADPTKSKVAITIDPTSIQAGSDIWKEHLSGGDFFDMSAHPEITFNSTSIESTGENQYAVTGDLTVKGNTKPATFQVTINNAMNHPMSGKPVIGLNAEGQLLRSDFAMGKFAPNVGDEVMVEISAELLKGS